MPFLLIMKYFWALIDNKLDAVFIVLAFCCCYSKNITRLNVSVEVFLKCSLYESHVVTEKVNNHLVRSVNHFLAPLMLYAGNERVGVWLIIQC